MAANTTAPLVSVITPCRNAARFLPQTLESVAAQTLDDYEHLLIDDASTDATADILAASSAESSRVRTFHLHRQRGPATARNIGIEQARGRFIAFLDSDDLWLPCKLERQLSAMTATDIALSYTAYYWRAAEAEQDRLIRVPRTTSYDDLLNATVIATLTAVYDRAQLGRRTMPDIARRQDYALWLAILRTTPYALGLQEPLAVLRRHPDSLSADVGASLRSTWRVYRRCEKLSLPRSAYHFARYCVHAARKRF